MGRNGEKERKSSVTQTRIAIDGVSTTIFVRHFGFCGMPQGAVTPNAMVQRLPTLSRECPTRWRSPAADARGARRSALCPLFCKEVALFRGDWTSDPSLAQLVERVTVALFS